MSVKVRMSRVGGKKNPYYRIVVTDERAPRDGRFIEMVGTYDPRKDQAGVRFKMERLEHWLSKGAQPTQTVAQLIRRSTKSAPQEP
ncbi:MAG: 30S ribosomal protein S16 [Deltaproteobacteria bacterium]|nr:30S ribosomal protein S16 [Deltaproteobacteria bacterium]